MTCHSSSNRWVFGGSALLAALALAACGGGDSGGASSAPPGAAAGDAVPPAAANSVGSFVTYQKNLAADDQAEPLLLNGFLPPTDDHAEPFPIG